MNLKLSLRGKLFAAVLMLIAVAVVVGGIGLYSLNRVAENYSHVANINLANSDVLGKMQGAQSRLALEVVKLDLESSDDALLAKTKENVKVLMAAYEEAAQVYLSVEFVEGEAELYEPVAKAWKNFAALTKQVVLDGAVPDTFYRANQEYADRLEKLTAFQAAQGKTWSAAAESVASKARIVMTAFLAIGFLVSVIGGYLFARALSAQLDWIASGLSANSGAVLQQSMQISEASSQLSSSMLQQASAVEETAASMAEIEGMVGRSESNAEFSNKEVSAMNLIATEGRTTVERVTTSIGEIIESNTRISDEVEHGNQKLEKIVTLIDAINSKTKVINDIVFQTRLLSFNASVEAARAGEHGKGFAVVAEEVGKLAQMSGAAAGEINHMLTESAGEVRKIVSETKQSVAPLIDQARAKLTEGSTVSAECAEIFDKIVSQVEIVRRSVGEITTASREQSQGVRKISEAMALLNNTIQQNSAATQSTASVAVELKTQAEDLKTKMLSLNVVVTGDAQGGEARARAA